MSHLLDAEVLENVLKCQIDHHPWNPDRVDSGTGHFASREQVMAALRKLAEERFVTLTVTGDGEITALDVTPEGERRVRAAQAARPAARAGFEAEQVIGRMWAEHYDHQRRGLDEADASATELEALHARYARTERRFRDGETVTVPGSGNFYASNDPQGWQ